MSQKLLSFLRKKLLRRHQLQKLWLKINGAEIELGVTFYGKVHVAGNPRNIYIGERTSINEYKAQIKLGRYVRSGKILNK